MREREPRYDLIVVDGAFGASTSPGHIGRIQERLAIVCTHDNAPRQTDRAPEPILNKRSTRIMPSGERSQTWFPELVTLLRSEWDPSLSWDEIVALRNRLNEQLQQIRVCRNIVPATVRCSHCGGEGIGASSTISVRAMILAVARFGIQSPDDVREIERAWKRHRAAVVLDLNGEPNPGEGRTTNRHRCLPGIVSGGNDSDTSNPVTT